MSNTSVYNICKVFLFSVSFYIMFSILLGISYGADNNAEHIEPVKDKFSLWTGKTKLRGANIWQTRAYNGQFSYQIGDLPVGPIFTQKDFYKLAEMGANYVNISCPGLFTESAPHKIDINAQKNLDDLLQMITKADMFAVISFRTGPGRSEFTFARDEVNDWFKAPALDETVWTDISKQDAWVKMWHYTAKRYRKNPIVVGYDLMVEPNSNEILGIDEPEIFYKKYANTLPDWNQFFPKIISAIREVDKSTPILVGGMGYSAVDWQPYLKPVNDLKIIYAIHQYAPFKYTHQGPRGKKKYPGKFDLDWDGKKDMFNKNWLEKLLSPIASSEFTIAVNEFGIQRWVPGNSQFMKDSFELFEKYGCNHALWMWYPDSYPKDMGEFNFLLGPKAKNYIDVSKSDLINTIRSNWKRNIIRPSNLNG